MGVMSVGSGGCWLGPATIRVAVAVPPFPPSFEVTGPVVLFCVPEVTPVTFKEKEQEEIAESVAPERLTLLDPAAAVIVPPSQVPVNVFGVAITCPDGRVSVNPTPLKV